MSIGFSIFFHYKPSSYCLGNSHVSSPRAKQLEVQSADRVLARNAHGALPEATAELRFPQMVASQNHGVSILKRSNDLDDLAVFTILGHLNVCIHLIHNVCVKPGLSQLLHTKC